MVESSCSCLNKPTLYIDQNVLSLMVHGVDPEFFERLPLFFHVLISQETFREIKRSGCPDKYLEALEKLKPKILIYGLDKSFDFTGDIRISDLNLRVAYSEFCQVEPIQDLLYKATRSTTLKIFGGRKDEDFESVQAEQKQAFSELMHMIDGFVSSEGLPEDVASGMRAYRDRLKSQFDEVVEVSGEQMRKFLLSGEEVSGVKNYRKNTGIGPVELNNIRPPNVLQKVFLAHSELEGYAGKGFSIDQFYGISAGPIYGREQFFHEKVTSIYNVLNIVGFNQDTRLSREARQISSASDAAHASIAIGAELLVSCDEAFLVKVRAIYDFLGLPTQVHKLEKIDGLLKIIPNE
ncbi:hypothetical protein [Pseudomonas sp. SWRI77]|uniref:hypothetical protein n=1 Tax=Pseudomonas sp. SWRI77 TaxID=2745485 RepID=UPI001648CFB8|nr:hypothetical protein [Pseudomonas sp. SWRI77]MBC3481741.1 hypothetical protein [Pseudomonas sp. SWRI77]